MIVKKEEAKIITELIKELFTTYDFESEKYEGWIIPNGSDYAMKGYWYPTATTNAGQLTIEVFINSEMIIVESFSGIGDSDKERLKNAFSSFVHHDFSVMLLSIWKKESQTITEERWEIGEESYVAYIGSHGILNYDREKSLEIPSSYRERIKTIISKEVLEKEFHWFTFFYANLNGLDSSAEVIKDNIKCISGEKSLKTLPWKRSNHYYAVRQFVLLKKI